MARLPRLLLPGYPLHVIVRGHNRQTVFIDDDDRRAWLDWLRDAAREYELSIHAWVQMDNHAHLLVTPIRPEALARTMQSLGRRYTQRFNRQHGCSGTLWEGRYKSSLIDSERYLLACAVYIELNPVRAGMVIQPEDWPWSSYRHHAGLEKQSWLTEHPRFWALGNTPFERQSAWRALVAEGLASAQVEQITQSALHGWGLGDTVFLRQLEQEVGRRTAPLPRGRPVGTQKKPVSN